MKKALSAILLSVFLFHVGGYYLVFWGLRYQTDRQLTSMLDENQYATSETILIKVPVALPYPIQSHDFQRVDGRFEHNGEFFKLVKHKLQNDTLHIVCIRDEKTRQIANVMHDYVQLAQDLTGDAPGKGAMSYLSKLIKDLYCQSGTNAGQPCGYCMEINFAERPYLLNQLAVHITDPPPRG